MYERAEVAAYSTYNARLPRALLDQPNDDIGAIGLHPMFLSRLDTTVGVAHRDRRFNDSSPNLCNEKIHAHHDRSGHKKLGAVCTNSISCS